MSGSEHMLYFQKVAGVSIDTSAGRESIVLPAKPVMKPFFTLQSGKPAAINPSPVSKFQPDWVLMLFMTCAILLAWVQVFYFKRFRQILVAPYSKRFLNQLTRDGNLFTERISLVLAIVYIIIISLFLYQLNATFVHDNFYDLGGIRLYLVIVSGLVIYWIMKIGLIKLLGNIFRTSQRTDEYVLNTLIMIILTGLSALPFLILAIYLKSDFFLYVCLIIFLLLLILRVGRGFLIGISISKFSYLLLFVYLCSLEILPLIIVAKIILLYSKPMIVVY